MGENYLDMVDVYKRQIENCSRMKKISKIHNYLLLLIHNMYWIQLLQPKKIHPLF